MNISSSGGVGAGDTKFIPNLKIEIYFIRDTNGFLNMDILYSAATPDIFIFVVDFIKRYLIYVKIMAVHCGLGALPKVF